MTLADLLEHLERDGYLLVPGYLDANQFESSGLLHTLKATFYPPLAELANHWNRLLEHPVRYPSELAAFHGQCSETGQHSDRSRFTRLREQQYQPLRQSPNGFPLYLCALFSRPGEDFSGGELTLTEQRPRMQSRVRVVPLRQGDIAIIPAAQRPVSGARGYYRVATRNAISRVHQGERRGLELFFDL